MVAQGGSDKENFKLFLIIFGMILALCCFVVWGFIELREYIAQWQYK